MLFDRDVTISINAAVIVSSLVALAALCQVQMLFVCGIDALMNKYNFRTVQFF